LLIAVGMRLEGHFIENTFFKGAWGSELSFAILARELV
jgi:RimJ/RimL family protein N-acetyltransferase